MDYKKLALSVEECSQLLPQDVFEMYLNGKVGLYGGFDEDLLVCYAAFSASSVDKTMMILEYVFVDEAYRCRKLSKELIDFCGGLFYQHGVRSIYVRLTGHLEDLLGPTLYLKKMGFLITTYRDHYLEYYVSDLLEAQQMETIAKSRDKLPKTELISSLSDRRLRRLTTDDSLCWKIDPGCFNKDLSNFYVKDGEINAALICNKPSSNRLFVSSYFVAKAGVNPFMFSVMLFDTLASAWEDITPSARINIYVSDQKILKLLDSFGVRVLDDDHVHEFLYVIPDDRKEVTA